MPTPNCEPAISPATRPTSTAPISCSTKPAIRRRRPAPPAPAPDPFRSCDEYPRRARVFIARTERGELAGGGGVGPGGSEKVGVHGVEVGQLAERDRARCRSGSGVDLAPFRHQRGHLSSEPLQSTVDLAPEFDCQPGDLTGQPGPPSLDLDEIALRRGFEHFVGEVVESPLDALDPL